MSSEVQAKQDVQKWIEECVLGLNLCPFAHKPFREGSVRLASTPMSPRATFWLRLEEEINVLNAQSNVSNTLFILEDQTMDFFAYLDLLQEAEDFLAANGWEGVYQIASFHPDYIFEGEDPKGRSHFTNRSPWPLLHLLRESEVSRAVDSYKETETIPERNKASLEALSPEEFVRLFGSRSRR
jgi:hypothetical protein